MRKPTKAGGTGKKRAPAGNRPPAKKAVAEKPARSGGASHVNFGLHGITNIVNRVREAGLESQFNQELGHDDKFVKVHRQSLANIKKFVESKPQLADLATDIKKCDCPPDDPYCIYI
jgi:hypothetical protein